MKILILYDSNFGNTQKIADHIANQFADHEAASISVNDFNESHLIGVRLLIMGSPINAWRPTKKIRDLLNSFIPSKMKGIKGAAFDTRVKSFISGNAAKKIYTALANLGVIMNAPPIGFFVKGNEGPLLEGELKKAEEWVKVIKTKT